MCVICKSDYNPAVLESLDEETLQGRLSFRVFGTSARVKSLSHICWETLPRLHKSFPFCQDCIRRSSLSRKLSGIMGSCRGMCVHAQIELFTCNVINWRGCYHNAPTQAHNLYCSKGCWCQSSPDSWLGSHCCSSLNVPAATAAHHPRDLAG